MLKYNLDQELEQAIIRLLIGCVIAFYLMVSVSFQTWWTIPFIIFSLSSISLILHSYFVPGNFWWRRLVGQVIDLGTISVILYHGGEATLPAVGVYLWVILGNGFRFGFSYLFSALIISTLAILFLANIQPYWIEHKAWSLGLGVTFLIVPIYFSILLSRLRKAQETIETISQHDDLTGLLNRRAFDSKINSEFSRLQSYPAPFALALIDIDDFKSVNEEYGRLIGNKVLISISEVLKQTCRDIDILARYGSDEFALLLPGYYNNEDELLGERLRQAVNKCVITIGEDTIQVTVSIGIAHWNDQYQNGEEWVYDAVMALFGAKKRGCNKIFIANHGPEPNRKAVSSLSFI